MIYKFKKYSNVADFVNNKPKTSSIEFTILDKCGGIKYDKKTYSFSDKCFACFFCIFDKENDLMHSFEVLCGSDFISSYAKAAFCGVPIILQKLKKNMSNPFPRFQKFTAVNETTQIQPWACALLHSMCIQENRISMEVPVLNQNYDRGGRIDICSIATKNELLAMESKTSLDDALADERYIEQKRKYIEEIEKVSSDYVYITLIGGKETDLYPSDNLYCTGKIGGKSDRFYKSLIENKMQFMSADALWCLCCRFLAFGHEYAWDNFIMNTFKDKNCIGLLSAGKVILRNEKLEIDTF